MNGIPPTIDGRKQAALIALCIVAGCASLLSAPADTARTDRQKDNACTGCLQEDLTTTIGRTLVALDRGTVFLTEGDLCGMRFPKSTVIPVGKNGIPFAGGEWVTMPGRGRRFIKSGALALDVTLEVGRYWIPFRAKLLRAKNMPRRGRARISFYEDGTVSKGWIADSGVSVQVGPNTVRIPGGGRIIFHNDGSIGNFTIRDGTEFQVGPNRFTFYDNRVGVDFHPNGTVKSGAIRGRVPARIGGREIFLADSGACYASYCGIAVGCNIEFHANGSVAGALLADTIPFEIQGRKVRLVAQWINLDTAGGLVTVSPRGEFCAYRALDTFYSFRREPDIYECVDCRPMPDTLWPAFRKDLFVFDYRQMVLSKDTVLTINGNQIPFRARRTFLWPSGGGIQAGTLQRPTTLQLGPNRIRFLADDPERECCGRHLQFSRQGALLDGPGAYDQRIKAGENTVRLWALAPTSKLGHLFFENGAVTGGILYEDTPLRVGDRTIIFKAMRFCPLRHKEESADIAFYSNGAVAYGYIDHALAVDVREDHPVFFVLRPHGKTLTLQAGQKVYFRRDGAVKLAYSASRLIPYAYVDMGEIARSSYPCTDTASGLRAIDASGAGDTAACRTDLLVTSSKEGVDVYVDGRRAGAAPLKVINLSAGRHRVALWSDVGIARHMKHSFHDSASATAFVESLMTGEAMKSDSIAGGNDTLAAFGHVSVALECGSGRHVHYTFDGDTMDYFVIYSDYARTFKEDRRPGFLASVGWCMFEDLADTSLFARFTRRAVELIDPAAKGTQWVMANSALVDLLRNNTDAAVRLYRQAMSIDDSLGSAIQNDFRVATRIVPDAEERIFAVREQLGLCAFCQDSL